ncbi:protein phosphatase [Lithospermum erythrorhizon]|uniref:protein-serine/threonine phosphatase n=1 Tax=Lithospermum erythrorhizon TaxID=34254 RepID=A0AAV3NIN9_LITER
MAYGVTISNSPVLTPLKSPLTLHPFTFRLPQQTPRGINIKLQSECATSASSSKRKRAMRIDIPVADLRFEAIMEEKNRERVDEVEVEGENYSVFCKRGKRAEMEDRYAAVLEIQGDSKQAFFGVFDGHGGAKAAEYAAENLGRNIVDEVAKKGEEGIEEAVKEGYLTTDEEFLKEDVNGGTCCVTVLIRQGDLVVSNAGDCRAVMCRGGVAEALTVDHRPSRGDEKERIQNNGGYVDCCRGVWRIQGSLAVSRGIGDRHLKKWVIAEPETRRLKISEECEFLILASDGLWDKVDNQEAVDVVRPFFVGATNPDSLSACKKLVELSSSRGSSDDTSVVVIRLDQFAS